MVWAGAAEPDRPAAALDLGQIPDLAVNSAARSGSLISTSTLRTPRTVSFMFPLGPSGPDFLAEAGVRVEAVVSGFADFGWLPWRWPVRLAASGVKENGHAQQHPACPKR
jgi:hypothetical protein